MNAAEAEIARLLDARLGEVGRVSDLALGRGSVRLTLELAGQGSPVELSAEGLRWDTEDGQLVLRWERAGSSLAWADALIRALGERARHEVRLPDSLRLAPLKLLLPRG